MIGRISFINLPAVLFHMEDIRAIFFLSTQQYAEIQDYLFAQVKYHDLAVHKVENKLVENKYYDSINRGLTSNDSTLKLRKCDGESILFFKKKINFSNGVFVRESSSVSLIGDPELSSKNSEPVLKAREIVGEDNLRQIAKMTSHRTSIYFKGENFLVKGSLDHVVVVEPRSTSFHEFELELTKGNLEIFKNLVNLLSHDFQITFSKNTKFERAIGVEE
jgi:inorganic triphosphatase YgiF